MAEPHRIVFCACAYADTIPEGTRQGVLAAFAAAGCTYELVTDLCQLVADRDPRLGEWTRTGTLTILACHPRAVRSLFAAAGVTLSADRVRIVDLRTGSVAAVSAELALGVPDKAGSAPAGELPWVTPVWIPWFPVIDRQRCTNCQQCLSFCLFGVYERDHDGNVRVSRPRNCKTHCPACARICPEVAIVFPKHAEGVISGEDVADEAAERSKARECAAQMRNADPYAVLQRRRRMARTRLLADPEP